MRCHSARSSTARGSRVLRVRAHKLLPHGACDGQAQHFPLGGRSACCAASTLRWRRKRKAAALPAAAAAGAGAGAGAGPAGGGLAAIFKPTAAPADEFEVVVIEDDGVEHDLEEVALEAVVLDDDDEEELDLDLDLALAAEGDAVA